MSTQFPNIDGWLTREPESLTEDEFSLNEFEQIIINLADSRLMLREFSELLTEEMAEAFDINLKSMVTVLESLKPVECSLIEKIRT